MGISRFALALGAVAVLALGVSAPAAAQNRTEPRGELRMSEGPYYAEVPITLQLRIEGFDLDPEPKITPSALPAEAELNLSSLSPSRQSFMSSRNGKMTSWERITWVANYEFIVRSPGMLATPDFVVTQGNKKVSVAGVRIQAGVVPLSDRIGIELVLPERTLFPGQRVPIEIRMKLDSSLQDSVSDYAIRSPLFELQGDFNFIDEEMSRGDQALEILVSGDPITLKRRVDRYLYTTQRALAHCRMLSLWSCLNPPMLRGRETSIRLHGSRVDPEIWS